MMSKKKDKEKIEKVDLKKIQQDCKIKNFEETHVPEGEVVHDDIDE